MPHVGRGRFATREEGERGGIRREDFHRGGAVDSAPLRAEKGRGGKEVVGEAVIREDIGGKAHPRIAGKTEETARRGVKEGAVGEGERSRRQGPRGEQRR